LTASRTQKMLFVATWALAVLLLLVLGLKFLRDFVFIPSETSSIQSPNKKKAREQVIQLYFADENSDQLATERRNVKLGTGTTTDAASIMKELISGPQSTGLFQTIPPETRLLNAYKIGGTLVLDFTREIQSNHPGGTTGELLTVYSIVNTMTENLHDIAEVQILVEGQEIETLAGHLDLSRPVRPRKNWKTG
jgi:germination protein M